VGSGRLGSARAASSADEIEVGLQRFILRTLHCKLSLGLSALVLDLLRLLGTLVLDLLLASILLRGEPEPDGNKHERNYEQL
jgi:hypothetical protein